MHHKKSTFWHVLLSAIAVIMVWRGVWNLVDKFLLPEYEIPSNIISITVGIILLYYIDRSLRKLA